MSLVCIAHHYVLSLAADFMEVIRSHEVRDLKHDLNFQCQGKVSVLVSNVGLYISGAERFYDAIELMLGKRISLWFKLCWKILTPVVTMVKYIKTVRRMT